MQEIHPELVIHSSNTRRIFLRQRTPLLVGSGPECDVRIDDENVSTQHCRLLPDADGGWLVEDMESGSGTYVNGHKVRDRVPLPNGAWIRLGTIALRLLGDGESDAFLSGDPYQDAVLLGQLLDALDDLAQPRDPEDVLRVIVDRGIRIGSGERGALFLAAEGDRLEVAMARDLEHGDLPLDQVLTRSMPRRSLTINRPVVLPNLKNGASPSDVSPSIALSRRRCVICIPLPGTDAPRGVLYVDSLCPAKSFGSAELAVLNTLAHQASRALERADRARLEAERRQRLEAENVVLKTRLGVDTPIAECDAMNRILELLRRAAPSEATVCLTGETGTGKEILARYLHHLSPRAGKPFVVVDCGALPESLIESELFGHEQGAFTGASTSRQGRLREADGGVVFLDEIGELPLALQPRLLRFLQEQVVRPVGGQPVSLDVRVVCATHRDLEAMVGEGTFRRDLFYRLAVLTLEIPPLRERGDEVLLLAEHLLERCQGTGGEARIRGFTREAREALRTHRWAGNVRELEHRIRRGVLLATSRFITSRDLGLGDEDGETPEAAGSETPFAPLPKARAQANERFERAYLERILARAGGAVSTAAELAGVSRQVIHTLMKRHGVDRERFRPAVEAKTSSTS